MTFFVLAIGIANLALGYFAAVALMEPPVWAGMRLRLPRLRASWFRRRKAVQQPSDLQTAAPINEPNSPIANQPQIDPEVREPGTIAGLHELPAEWLLQLAAEGIVAESFVEGAAQVLRLEVTRYREHLLAAEERCRALAATNDASGLRLLAGDLQIINQDWLSRQSTAAGMLSQRTGRHGDHEAAAAALDQVLLDQAAEIRGICTALETHDTLGDVDGGVKQLLEGMGTLLDQSHSLRDGMVELLATLLRTGNRLDSLSPTALIDQPTRLPNRTGLEVMLAKWWSEDPERTRPLSVVLVDIDRFSRLNRRLGAQAGDLSIAALSGLFHELISKDGSADRIARVDGEAFLVLMPDAGPREALTAAERLRQTVEAMTFDHQGAEFELTVSCGVIEVAREESILDLLHRAKEALRYAKKAGRNRCALDEGRGPTTLEPPQFPVKGRLVRLGEQKSDQ